MPGFCDECVVGTVFPILRSSGTDAMLLHTKLNTVTSNWIKNNLYLPLLKSVSSKFTYFFFFFFGHVRSPLVGN